MENIGFLNEEESLKLYEETISLVKDIYNRIQAGKEFIERDKDIIDYLNRYADQQYLNNDNILNLVNIQAKDDYMYNHVVNVCIISIDIGIGMGYDRPQLFELGKAAILHDIGMIKLYDVYNKPRRLSPEEYKEIKTHPLLGAEILEKLKIIAEKTVTATTQEHERIDGSGYPHGLKKEAIDEYAKIIGLADVYEAMTHVRPYRDKFHPYEALKEIIDAKDTFEKKIIKVLIERICCPYPLGSYVKLSTGEKGEVIKRNLRNSFRPIVEINYDSKGKRLRKPRIVDLIKYPSIYIKGHLKNNERNEE